jgi:hypothetical protein
MQKYTDFYFLAKNVEIFERINGENQTKKRSPSVFKHLNYVLIFRD